MAVTREVGLAGPSTAEEGAAPAALTVEMAVYVAIGALAAAVRLWDLGAWPLRVDEATQALAAWNLANGASAGAAQYSPLLATANMVLFTLFGAGDAIARLWPALFGILLALSPALLRPHISRTGALVASLLLALSPTVVHASRSLDGRIVAVTAGLFLVASLFRLIDTRQGGYRILGAAALVAGLLSAPIFYSVLLILALGLFVLGRGHGIWRVGQAAEEREGDAAWARLRGDAPSWRKAAIFAAALLALLATGLFMNLDGFGAAAGFLPAWLRGFAWGAESMAPGGPAWAFAVYEPLLLVFGAAGMVSGWKRRDELKMLLGWWLLSGLALSLLTGGWEPVDLVLLAVPSAVLAGSFLGDLVQSAVDEPLLEGEAIIPLFLIPVAVYGYLQLGAYTFQADLIRLLLSIGVPILISLTFMVALSMWIGRRRALRGAGFAVALLLGVVMVSTMSGSNYNADPARHDLLAMDRVEREVRDLVGTMERYAAQTIQSVERIPVMVVGDELAWLQWPLRSFGNAEFVSLYGPGQGAALVLSPIENQPPLGETYTGQRLPVRTRWRPSGMNARGVVDWLLYRKLPRNEVAEMVQRDDVIMWAARAD